VEEPRRELGEFRAEIDGFSGPFDLLCWLVENRELEAANISVGQVVRIYGAYLANTSKVPVSVVSEFLLMAASLVLNKIRALLPGRGPSSSAEDPGEEYPSDVLEKLSRYRPYRTVAWELAALKERRDRFFFRVPFDEDVEQSLDLGDLYALCRLWWNLRESKRKTRSSAKTLFLPDEDEWSGVPSSLPDEEQIERKISEILSQLFAGRELRLSALLRANPARSNFIVTLLALLEMSRMGRIRISQEALFDDVLIRSL
jgi:segregation and condensation protein A